MSALGPSGATEVYAWLSVDSVTECENASYQARRANRLPRGKRRELVSECLRYGRKYSCRG
jgi:hypothetical protein